MADWRSTLRQNWPYMVTAVLVSLFLWVGVSADKVQQEAVSADLIVINNDREYVLTRREPAMDVVTVAFRGSAFDIGRLDISRPQIIVPIDSVASPVMEMTLSPNLVRARSGRELTAVQAVDVEPDRITLYFQPRVQKVVRVVPDLRLQLAEGFALGGPVTVEPQTIAIAGPDSAVAATDSIMTAPISRNDVRSSIDAEVPVGRPPGGQLLEMSESNVRVRVPVEPVIERIVENIAVLVPGIGDGEYTVRPPVVEVSLMGPRSLVESIDREALEARIDFRDEGDYGRPLEVRVTPPDPRIDVSVRPDSVRVIRTGSP